jgi:hypothetical protein
MRSPGYDLHQLMTCTAVGATHAWLRWQCAAANHPQWNVYTVSFACRLCTVLTNLYADYAAAAAAAAAAGTSWPWRAA